MRLAIALLACLPAVAALAPAIDRPLRVRIPMRDNVKLEANVFRPLSAGRLPTILIRTPYGKGAEITPNQLAFVERGYVIMVQDVRGRHGSEGVFRPIEQEGPDGEDTLAWIARQSWSDGKVGMIGGSYLGMVQWQLAVRNPPQLKAIFPVVSGYDEYFDRFYSRGGGMKLGHRLLWMAENLRNYSGQPDFQAIIRHLPVRTADVKATGQTVGWYQRALDHPSYDSFWRSLSARERLDRLRVPVFSVGGWFDNYGQSDLEAFAELRRLGREARVLIGPWPHNMSDRFTTVDFGPDAVAPIRRLQLDWFDHWLKGKDTLGSLPVARYFTMGDNRWQETSTWPPPEVKVTRYYLSSKGNANTLDGDGVLDTKRKRPGKPDEFVYDPRNPVPTRGGAVCCNFRIFPSGPMDQRQVERRDDVLVYTSPELKGDLEVTGVVRVILYISTTAPDTDFTAKLVDVHPDGTALNVTDGMLRLRYRNGLDKPELAKPGEIYGINVDAGATSMVFKKGHRIRLEISSSNFPRFDRNPNTGRPIAGETQLQMARQTVYYGGLTPSTLMLPVAARGVARKWSDEVLPKRTVVRSSLAPRVR